MSKPIYKNVVFWILAILLVFFLGIGAAILTHLVGEALRRIEKENEEQGDIEGKIWRPYGMGLVGLSTFLSEILERQTAWGFSGCAAGLAASTSSELLSK